MDVQKTIPKETSSALTQHEVELLWNTIVHGVTEEYSSTTAKIWLIDNCRPFAQIEDTVIILTENEFVANNINFRFGESVKKIVSNTSLPVSVRFVPIVNVKIYAHQSDIYEHNLNDQ